MKRASNLYRLIHEPENLRRAFLRAARGKSDRPEVILYRRSLDDNLARLRSQLLAEQVAVGDYHFFWIKDPKPRHICAASFAERVLHHAVTNVCEPYFEAYAIFDSYACRREKGLHKAVVRCQQFARRQGWYLKLDIKKYFDSIDQARLTNILAQRFKDRPLFDLFAEIIGSYQTLPGKGLPIGNLLSQHWANLYLGLMDHWLKDDCGVKGYLRYMDDFVLFAESRQELKVRLREIEDFLAKKLALELKENRQLNRCALGIPFLGFRIFPDRIRLAPRSRRRFEKKLKMLENLYLDGDCNELELAGRVTALVDFTRLADAAAWRGLVLRRSGVSF